MNKQTKKTRSSQRRRRPKDESGAQAQARPSAAAATERQPPTSSLTANDGFLSLMGYSAQAGHGEQPGLFVDPQCTESEAYREFWAKLHASEAEEETGDEAGAWEEPTRASLMTAAPAALGRSAQQIARVIKVVDELAFKSHLLALNAAVEAARAGHSGRRFDLVAREVRSLAERSAKAASETAELLEDALPKLTHGVAMASKAGAALDAIVKNVAKVVDLADQIASASDEHAQQPSDLHRSLDSGPAPMMCDASSGMSLDHEEHGLRRL